MTIHDDTTATSVNGAVANVPNQNPNGDGSVLDVKPGMISDVKNLYQSKPDNSGQFSWVDKYPDNLEEATENAESARYALLIRNKKCYNGRKSLQIDSIVVQSPLLKKSLGRVLANYHGITTSLERLTFNAPFQPFVHRWTNLVQLLDDESDPEAKAHLDLFHRTLQTELKDDLKARADFILNGVITYKAIWMIFEPGSSVFSSKDNENRAARLVDESYIKTRRGEAYNLICEIVGWDGEDFGIGSTNFLIYEFKGTVKITNLPAYPLEYHPDLAKVKDELVQRGTAFANLSGYHYKNYQGIAIEETPWGPVKYNVDSRIIIDSYAWNRFNPNSKFSLLSLGSTIRPTPVTISEDFVDYTDSDDASDDESDSGNESEPGSVDLPMDQSQKLCVLTKEQLLLCSASLKGYSLRNKKWLEFFVGSVKDIEWNEGAFKSLVLPEEYKELILALTESQIKHKETFDDVIQGKGKGMIMLLSGPPGVGKTLTAESVAETMRAPLYMMSAGDLGLDSSRIESSLSNVLEMSTRWNAVLLLDEADVFLVQRSSHDLERNKLVSIFLRILEYYKGILFLTSNRVENIDAAFQSRIHVSMQYPELSASSRRHVWSNFLAASSKGTKHAFSDEDLDRLAGYTMNGREIKNVLKTAQLLASRKGVQLGAEHVETVLAIEKRHASSG